MSNQSLVGLLLFVAIMGVTVWIALMGNRRARFDGVSEVSATEQAALGQAARAMYTDPEWRLCNPASPSEFDQHVLSVLDSIETNRDDIDARIEALRVYLKGLNLFERFKDKQKLSLLYGNVAAGLVSGRMTLGRRQLFANWRMVGRIAPPGEGNISRAPRAWIRPLVNDAGATVPAITGQPIRGVLRLGRTATSIVAGLCFAVTGAMIAYMVRPDTTLVTEWFFGIFVGTLILYRTPLIRLK